MSDRNDERWNAHNREHKLLHRAHRLQAREYERRLSELNHAHAQAKVKEAEYVTRDKFEDYVKRADDARTTAFDRMGERLGTMEKALNERIDSLDLSRADRAGRTTGLTSGWKWAVGTIGLLLVLLQIYNLLNK